MYALTGGPLHGEVVFDLPRGYTLEPSKPALHPDREPSRMRHATWDRTVPVVFLS